MLSRSVMSSPLQPHGLNPTSLLCLWNSSGKNTGMDCHFLLQGIFPTQGSSLGLLHCRWILYHLSHQEGPESRAKRMIQLCNYRAGRKCSSMCPLKISTQTYVFGLGKMPSMYCKLSEKSGWKNRQEILFLFKKNNKVSLCLNLSERTYTKTLTVIIISGW